MDLMESELIPFLKSPKIFGLSLVRLLECSKWENALMVIQLMLVHTKVPSLVYLTTLCITLLTMFSATNSGWVVLSNVMMLKHLTSQILMLLVSLLIITTMLVSCIIILMQMLNSVMQLSSH